MTVACPEPCDMKDEDIKKVHAELVPVVEAVENFHTEQKVYPKTLTELSPKYLKTTPKKVGGREFSYIVVSDNEYKIRVNSPSGGSYSGSCEYTDIKSRWEKIK